MSRCQIVRFLLLVPVWLAVTLLACLSRGRVILDVEEAGEGAAVAEVDLGAGAARVSQWATRAHDWLLGSACAGTASAEPSAEPGAADPAEATQGDLCRDLVRLPRANIRVYAAGRESTKDTGGDEDAGEQVVATLVGPEGGRALGPHDAVLVLDPYPAASFGHLVLVFFVALRTTEERCAQLQGLRLGKEQPLSQLIKSASVVNWGDTLSVSFRFRSRNTFSDPITNSFLKRFRCSLCCFWEGKRIA